MRVAAAQPLHTSSSSTVDPLSACTRQGPQPIRLCPNELLVCVSTGNVSVLCATAASHHPHTYVVEGSQLPILASNQQVAHISNRAADKVPWRLHLTQGAHHLHSTAQHSMARHCSGHRQQEQANSSHSHFLRKHLRGPSAWRQACASKEAATGLMALRHRACTIDSNNSPPAMCCRAHVASPAAVPRVACTRMQAASQPAGSRKRDTQYALCSRPTGDIYQLHKTSPSAPKSRALSMPAP